MDKITTKAYYGLKGGQTDGPMEAIVLADNANNIPTMFRTFKECLKVKAVEKNHAVYIQNSLKHPVVPRLNKSRYLSSDLSTSLFKSEDLNVCQRNKQHWLIHTIKLSGGKPYLCPTYTKS